MILKNFPANFSKAKGFLYPLIFSLLLMGPCLVFGQKNQKYPDLEVSKSYHLKLKDGSEFLGKLISSDSAFVTISTKSIPEIQIPLDRIKIMELVDASQLKRGKYWFPNPHSTKYIFAPSALNLEKGEGFYQNTMLFLNSFELGLSNHLSVGGGIEFLSTFMSLASGEFSPIFYLNAKTGFKISDKLHLAGGILTVSVPPFGSDSRHYAGLLQGIGTYGNREHNLTAGVNWGYIDGKISATPVFNISGMTRISRRMALITENWIIPIEENQEIYSYGIRFFGEKIAVDLSFLNNMVIVKELPIGVPVVDFIVKF